MKNSLLLIGRFYSTIIPPVKISNRERIQLARASIKDIFDGFITNEESFEPIDIKPIFKDPKKFVNLSTFHRDQVIDEVTKRLTRNWNQVSIESKRMAYFIAYGNWGIREDLLDSIFTNFRPEDLPFEYPSQIRTINPKISDIIHKLPPVDLMQVNEKRRKEFKRMTRTLDPVSKVVVYFAVIITMAAVWRDKWIGESGLIKVQDLESPLIIAERKYQEELIKKILVEKEKKKQYQQSLIESKKKRWYYLWLK